MQTIVGVRFKSAGKIYSFGQGQLTIAEGDYVIVETTRGMECGKVVIAPREVPDESVPPNLRVVHRIADSSDLARIEENRTREREARTVCEEKIRELGLKMKLVDVELTFDLSKMLFYFTADGRVDFRQLVRELAGVFRTRIELRQIGVRDEA
ncbi:MAG: stage 0 sporulation family protein, partial [Selenomonas massiliensis]